MSLLFLTIKEKETNTIVANKVALRCDFDNEDIENVAEETFNNICKMESVNPEKLYYETYIKLNGSFYRIDKEETEYTKLLKKVKKNGLLLQYIDKNEQTEELCNAAVYENSFAYKYVAKKFQSVALYTIAVTRNPNILSVV